MVPPRGVLPRVLYVNTNFVVLGLVIEKVTGQTVEEHLNGLISELGLTASSYPSNDEFLVRGDPETGTPENLNLLLGVIGGKVNIGRGLLVNAGVLFPLTNSGLQPKVTPYFGFDYVF